MDQVLKKNSSKSFLPANRRLSLSRFGILLKILYFKILELLGAPCPYISKHIEEYRNEMHNLDCFPFYLFPTLSPFLFKSFCGWVNRRTELKEQGADILTCTHARMQTSYSIIILDNLNFYLSLLQRKQTYAK